MSTHDMIALLGVISLITFFGSLVAVPWIIGRMQADYFVLRWQANERPYSGHPALAMTLRILRNTIGLLMVVAGLAMLVLPGQGLLTILIGVCLMNFPGKHLLLLRLIRMPSVQKGLNWIRRKRHREGFLFP